MLTFASSNTWNCRRKRLLVAPPAASVLLHPFPFLHPSHAQCQASPAALGHEALAAAGAQRACSVACIHIDALELELQPRRLLCLHVLLMTDS